MGLWIRLVEEYSKLDLTFDKDKLPALAAIASEFQELAPTDRYLLGIWQSDLMKQLIWYRSSSSKPSSNANLGSWSWASDPSSQGVEWDDTSYLDARSEDNEPRHEVLRQVKVVDIDVRHVGSPLLGKVSCADITLSAPSFKARVVAIDRNVILKKPARALARHHYYADVRDVIGEELLVCILTCHYNLHGIVLRVDKTRYGSFRRTGYVSIRKTGDIDRSLMQPEGKTEGSSDIDTKQAWHSDPWLGRDDEEVSLMPLSAITMRTVTIS